MIIKESAYTNHYMELHQLLLLADKLLYYMHVAGCYEICNEAQNQIKVNALFFLLEMQLQQKLRSIQRELNAIMAQEVRRSLKGDYHRFGSRTCAVAQFKKMNFNFQPIIQ